MIRTIIVLYKSDFHSSETLQSIQKIDEHLKKNISIDIYDNSPECSSIDYGQCLMNFKSVTYVSDVRNNGLSAAYNYALKRCEKYGDHWLLLLDQDTEVNNSFIKQIISIVNQSDLLEDVAAIVPDIVDEQGKIIVPVKVSRIFGRYSFIDNSDDKIISDEIRTINSCSLINVKFLQRIGGFNKNFKLDCLDHWLFLMIHRKKQSVYLTHDQVVHNLSVNDSETYVSTERYKSILNSEQLFYSEYTDKLKYAYFKLRLVKRAIKQRIKVKNKEIFKMTLKGILGIKL